MTQNNKAGARSRFIKASPRLIRWLWIIAFAPVALLVFLLLLTATGLFGRLPSFEELENPKSNLATEIYSEDGKVLGTFFVQHEAQDQQRDDEVQKIAENVVEGQCDSGEPLGNEEAEYDAQRDSQEHFGK